MRLPAIAFVLCALAVPDAPVSPFGRLAAGRLRRPAALLQRRRTQAGPDPAPERRDAAEIHGFPHARAATCRLGADEAMVRGSR